MKLKRYATLAVTPLLLLAACGGGASEQPDAVMAAPPPPPPPPPPATTDTPPADATGPTSEPPPTPPPKTISVSLLSKSNSKVTGTVTLTEEDDGVKVAIQLANAKPGDHGMHIHEKADCSAPDAKSAGDHFNPEKHDHGMPDGDKRHLGDLGNISVDKDGTGTAETKVKGANLKPDDPMSFLRRSLIVHEKKDDGKTQPSGNSGARIACAELQQGGGPADEAAGTDKAQTKPANANTATDKAAADKASSSGANPSGKAKPPAR